MKDKNGCVVQVPVVTQEFCQDVYKKIGNTQIGKALGDWLNILIFFYTWWLSLLKCFADKYPCKMSDIFQLSRLKYI